MQLFDERLFNILSGLAGKNVFLDLAVVFFGSPAIFIFGFIIIYILFHEESMHDLWLHVRALVFAVVAGEVFEGFIHLFYNRPRPFEVVSIPLQLLHRAPGFAFPSSHALFAFLLASLIAWWRPRWSAGVFLLATLIAVSRVIGGVHWPSDVVAGALVGICSAMFAFWILQKKTE